MPTYGYRCETNGHEFETFQGINDPALRECEVCGAPVTRIFYPVGIVFKGPGFYKTDSRGSSSSSSPAAGGGAESGSGSSEKTDSGTGGSATGGGGKADSKGETKTDTKTDTKAKPAARSETKPAGASGDSKSS